MKKKYCPKCCEWILTTAFRPNHSRSDWLASYCIECEKICQAEWYSRNKVSAKLRARRNSTKTRKALQRYICNYLSKHPCIDCGEKDIVVLEFDHVSGKKVAEICFLVRSGVSLVKLNTEIAKCVVRCANCHIRKTAKQLKWFKAVMTSSGEEAKHG